MVTKESLTNVPVPLSNSKMYPERELSVHFTECKMYSPASVEFVELSDHCGNVVSIVNVLFAEAKTQLLELSQA